MFIRPDLTRAQREIQKKLVESKKKENNKLPEGSVHYVGIRNGEVRNKFRVRNEEDNEVRSEADNKASDGEDNQVSAKIEVLGTNQRKKGVEEGNKEELNKHQPANQVNAKTVSLSINHSRKGAKEGNRGGLNNHQTVNN